MGSPEMSSTIAAASDQYHEYELDQLPPELQRDSRLYYYLSVYPGLKNMVELDTDQPPKLPDTVQNAYIHTPYCTGVCSFCSYFLTTVSEQDRSPINAYFETVKSEIEQRADQTNLDLSYLYFGGGTPSLIPNETLESFFGFLKEKRLLGNNPFGTIELHPEFFNDLSSAQGFIDILRAHGIGRVSLGFESSDAAILESTNRRHGTYFLREAIDFLKQNELLVSLDLMYGLPGLTLGEWEHTLNDALSCNPDSVATYFLFVNPGTVMHTQVARGEVALPSHKTIQTQHLMAQAVLEQHGFLELPSDFYAKPQGDPSSFTQDSLPSDGASLPIGAGSYGFYDNTQFFNQFSLAKYRQQVEAGKSPIWRGFHFEGQQGMNRDLMFSFKNSPYIDRRLFESKYGNDPVAVFSQTFDMLCQYKLVEIDDTQRRVTLTPKGRLCVEEIAFQFQIPDLSAHIPTTAGPAERRKLDKHHFAPLYKLATMPRDDQSGQ